MLIMANAAIPMLSYEDAGRAADWLSEAFGFEQSDRFEDEGVVSHVTLTLGAAMVRAAHRTESSTRPWAATGKRS